ncbi:hypothetical protein BDR04DRAFT_1108388 [Suillus decipiens]|nr:hypothetical protein BDR04DRAFT_1108388 [Suillus decipiens]
MVQVAAQWRGQWVQVSDTTVVGFRCAYYQKPFFHIRQMCTRGTIHDAQFLAHNKLAYAGELS